MKFVLVVEGETEATQAPRFLKKWLDIRLTSRVGIDPVLLRGFGKFTAEIGKTVERVLKGPDNDEIIAVIGLLDLYGPEFYPNDVTAADVRYRWGQSYFKQQVRGEQRFRMFFAVHEFEAWIFAQPGVLPRKVRDNLPAKAKRPEAINFDQPPARLLDQLYRQHLRRGYEKVKHGKELFGKLEPDTVCDCCPRLKQMLDEMLHMAQAAGL